MQPGTIIGGRYQLVDTVAEGGLSTLWQGVSRSSEVFARPVAVKVMKRAFSAVGGPYLNMFLEEARIGAQLQHGNLVQVLDFLVEAGPQGPVYCLVMEWIDGLDLKTLIKINTAAGTQLPWQLVATVGIGVLRGLAAAHARTLPDGTLAPILHRDVSPQNVLLGIHGGIKLADFGMARARDRIAEHTAPGFVKGTLSYMAPEILMGKEATARSDLFSLGCTLWESLAGERLFHAPSDAQVIDMIRGGKIRSLAERRPDIPQRIVAAVHRALAMDPKDRFASARAMATDIGEILREEGGQWTDPDVLVGFAVGEARKKREQVGDPPPLPPTR
jgi:serine/threonine-protein kinase